MRMDQAQGSTLRVPISGLLLHIINLWIAHLTIGRIDLGMQTSPVAMSQAALITAVRLVLVTLVEISTIWGNFLVVISCVWTNLCQVTYHVRTLTTVSMYAARLVHLR